jgi:transposase InsO family protein
MTPSMSRPANPYDNAICERGAGSGPSNPASAGFGFQLHERLFEQGSAEREPAEETHQYAKCNGGFIRIS